MTKFFDSWPKYVKTIEHHVNGIYLVQSRQELIDLMLSTTERWYEDGDFGNKSWYTFESFEAYFAIKMGGMSWESFNTNIIPLHDGSSAISSLQQYGKSLVSKYKETTSYLEDLLFLDRIVKGERPTGYANRLYAILRESEYDGKPRFVVDNFDTI